MLGMSDKSLFDDFNPVSAKEWKQKIQFDLKGADYNETLVWESPEGIKVKPFYHADDNVNSYKVPVTSGWSVGQSIYVRNVIVANSKAKTVLEKGAESIQFIIPSDDIIISELLEGIPLQETHIYFDFHFLSFDYIKSLHDFIGDFKAGIHLNIDPIGHLARTGNWFSNLKTDLDSVNQVLDLEFENTLSIDSSLYQNAGANMVQQLAYSLAHANEYLNQYKNAIEKGPNITFKVAMGTNYFFEIAKLRALRILWAALANAYAISEQCEIIAMPSKRNKTLYDYNTNMLRTTTECMSAVLGGANMVLNMPYDAIYHKDNDFGERIALNQLLLLKNESHFDKVNNAADGAYYIEHLTNQLAEKALELFKQLEKGGGFLKQLKDTIIQKKIKDSAAKERKAFNSGEEVLLGTNKYVNELDKMKDTMELYPFVKKNSRKTLIEPIIERRLAEEVEQKRLNNE